MYVRSISFLDAILLLKTDNLTWSVSIKYFYMNKSWRHTVKKCQCLLLFRIWLGTWSEKEELHSWSENNNSFKGVVKVSINCFTRMLKPFLLYSISRLIAVRIITISSSTLTFQLSFSSCCSLKVWQNVMNTYFFIWIIHDILVDVLVIHPC